MQDLESGKIIFGCYGLYDMIPVIKQDKNYNRNLIKKFENIISECKICKEVKERLALEPFRPVRSDMCRPPLPPEVVKEIVKKGRFV